MTQLFFTDSRKKSSLSLKVNSMSSNSPTVSIICPTYNHEKFIAQALEGFVTQKTNFPFEIIVHDDASTDRTADIVKEYEAKYPHLFANIYQTENQFSKEIGIIARITFAAARGKYIAICEGDDYWVDTKKLQKQVDFLDSNPDFAICFHKVKVKHENDEAKNYISNPIQKETSTFEDLANENFIHTLSCLFRNHLFEKFPDWLAHSPIGDYPLHLLNAQHGKIKFFEDVMGVYRVHQSGEWSLKSQKYQHEKWLIMLEFCYKHFYPLGSNEFEKQLVKILEFLCFTCFQERNYEEFSEYFKKITKLGKHLKLRTKLALYLRYIVGRQNTLARLYNKMR